MALLLTILIPLAAAILVFALGRLRYAKEFLTLLATAVNLYIAITLFRGETTYALPWAGLGMDFTLRLYHFSGFIVLATAFFGIAVSLYSAAFMFKRPATAQYYAYLLISIAFVNGAVLADNLVLMLFFWEGLLLTTFGLIAIGNKGAFRTATKAFVIIGVSDLCMMVGIGLTVYLAKTFTISAINLPLGGLGGLAFTLLMIGAISKAGAMPFHSWIPDAAGDAPLPFMAFLPASLEKLLGIYFLARISLDLYQLEPHSWVSTMLMIVGSITIVLAVMMALIQKEYKKLLSFHAISQVGYMVLGIGTCLPVGIVGGLFHMINHALYKSCLFLTGGSVEKQAGTTDLSKLGGLGLKMPITFICFIIAAASISGVPPFNGFFSKELVYDAAMERGAIFYIAAIIGSFFTAASFLKLGHAAFLGRINEENRKVRETNIMMIVPMIAIAAVCVIFGVYNGLPLSNLIQPILPEVKFGVHDFSGMPTNKILIIVTVIVLAGSLIHHIFASRVMGGGLKAAEHIRNAKFLSFLYDRAERRVFDPYEIGLKIIKWISEAAWFVDRKVDWVFNNLTVHISYVLSGGIRLMHNGNYVVYIILSLVGAFAVIIYSMRM